MEDLFQVFHLAKSSRKNFFDRNQKKFKRNGLFKRKIKNRLSNFYKIHGITYKENQSKKTLNRKLDKKVINYNIDQIPDIATAKTFDREQQSKTNKFFCVCNKPNDGSMYVFCETCHQWFHPKCVFEKGHLALTLPQVQWEKCNCICKGVSISTENKLVTFYHSLQFFRPINKQSPTIQSNALQGTSKDAETLKLLSESDHLNVNRLANCYKTSDIVETASENTNNIKKML